MTILIIEIFLTIIIVSDIHLGHRESDRNSFQLFLESKTIKNLTDKDHFILLGDIIDFWRRQNADAILDKDNESILQKIIKISSKTNLYYIIGNHDYSILKLYYRYGENRFPFQVLKNLRLEDNEKKFYFTHGYELEVFSSLEPLTIDEYEYISEILCNRTGGLTGGLLTKLWDTLDMIKSSVKFGKNSKIYSIQKPPKERLDMNKIDKLCRSIAARSILLGMKENEFLVFGHTHWPFIENESSVANSGSWIKYNKYYDSYLVIEEGRIELNYWKQ
jgi:UDP-2,3-diacylglucosamine pyrophosphatase LpxH